MKKKKKRHEAIRTRPNCLKFFQMKNRKSTMKNLKNKGKKILLEGKIWSYEENKERDDEKQISKEKERDKNYNAINKGKKEERKIKERKKEGDDE